MLMMSYERVVALAGTPGIIAPRESATPSIFKNIGIVHVSVHKKGSDWSLLPDDFADVLVGGDERHNVNLLKRSVKTGGCGSSILDADIHPQIFCWSSAKILFEVFDSTADAIPLEATGLVADIGPQFLSDSYFMTPHEIPRSSPQKPGGNAEYEGNKGDGDCCGSSNCSRVPMNCNEPIIPSAEGRHPFPMGPAIVGLKTAAVLSLFGFFLAWLFNR